MPNRLSLTKEQVDEFRKPLVYIFKKDKKYLYIGMSKLGIVRPLDRSHHVPQAADACSELIILPCGSSEEAARLEKKLIKFLKPQLNVAGNRDPRTKEYPPQVDLDFIFDKLNSKW